ncbi:diguanylate cyclase/phosphodiesterase [Thioploca ingrica]|uniref:Diguanylate cyclase/phosphodiesterase n=1 Tax=Thioploca ingrica TaxID=40754 RepID=A0A090AIH4_9GAMM|nr:diguanylate cyclase/phosphodiesterase [Thioploca ingrica]
MEKVRILIIEEEAQDYLNTRQLLDEQTSTLNIDWAPNYEIAVKRIKQNTYDAYLVGYHANHLTQKRFLNWLYKYTTVPTILITKTAEPIDPSHLDSYRTDFIAHDQLNWLLLERIIRYLANLLALQRRERNFQTIFDNAFQLMILLTLEGILQEINQTALKFFNVNSEMIIGSLLWEIPWIKSLPQTDTVFQLAIVQAAQGEFTHCEVKVPNAKNEMVIIDFSFTPLTNTAGETEWILMEGRDLSECRALEQQLTHTTLHDQLTGLPNRHLFLEYLDQAITAAQSNKDKHVAILFMDLDRFQLVNASLGHDMGDWLLMEIAQRLQGCLKKDTILARSGGDEFMILLDQMQDLNEATLLAATINEILASPFSLDGYEIITAASIGIAYYTGAEESTDLLRNADTAMYRAKIMGKAGYAVFNQGMYKQAVSRLQIETNLHQAIKKNNLVLLYQPQTELASEQLISTESVIRFYHPQNGLMSSVDFKPILEETGIIVSVEEWMLRMACQHLKAWLAAGLIINRIAVNLSAHQFRNKRLINMVVESIKESGLTPEYLELELTENFLLEDIDSTITTLKRFKDMGIRVTIDEFGMGYASLNNLKRLPIDSLKIDQSFIKGITFSPEDTAITVATIDMAHALGLTVIAEGVETIEQRDFLCDHGCDFAQGHLYAGPMENTAFLEWGKQYNKMVNTTVLSTGGYGQRMV